MMANASSGQATPSRDRGVQLATLHVGWAIIEYHRLLFEIQIEMASPNATLESFILESVVRGHHIYNRVWTTVLGERLQKKTTIMTQGQLQFESVALW